MMKTVTDPSEILIHALDLFSRSDLHRDWSVDDFLRLVMPPIRAGQILVLKNENDAPIGLATWAWLSPEAETGFLNRTRKLQPGDWTRDSDADQLWVIDVIAPDCAALMIREVERKLIHEGAEQAHWYRSRKGRRASYRKRKD